MSKQLKSYSLFQRAVRVAQTSSRRLDWWLLQHMPGLPNPPDKEAELRRPRYVDLWEFTLADHWANARGAWREYCESFAEPSELDLERSKQEVRAAVGQLRGEVEGNASKNLAFINEQLEGTQLQSNLAELQRTSSENVAFLKKEIEGVAEQVDTDAILAHARRAIDENRSKEDVATTLQKNVAELAELVKEGRDAALSMDKQDVERVREDAQSWLADKLMVGQDVMLAFIRGYREGKQLELEREDALLVTYARAVAEEQKEVLREHFDRFVADQRDKQRREREEQSDEQQQSSEQQSDEQQQQSDEQPEADEQATDKASGADHAEEGNSSVPPTDSTKA